jgi:hypothetical protein
MWIALLSPLVGQQLWLGVAAHGSPAAATESLSAAAQDVIEPVLSAPATWALALLWGVAALALPEIVRRSSFTATIVGAAIWAAAVTLGGTLVAQAGGLTAAGEPRGALITLLVVTALIVIGSTLSRSMADHRLSGRPSGAT